MNILFLILTRTAKIAVNLTRTAKQKIAVIIIRTAKKEIPEGISFLVVNYKR
jgi:hypothetical protein